MVDQQRFYLDKSLGWRMLKGRDFFEQLTTDSTGLVINQAAATLMGLQDPIGATIHWTWDHIYRKDVRIASSCEWPPA